MTQPTPGERCPTCGSDKPPDPPPHWRCPDPWHDIGQAPEQPECNCPDESTRRGDCPVHGRKVPDSPGQASGECEAHRNVRASHCPVCLLNERDRLKAERDTAIRERDEARSQVREYQESLGDALDAHYRADKAEAQLREAEERAERAKEDAERRGELLDRTLDKRDRLQAQLGELVEAARPVVDELNLAHMRNEERLRAKKERLRAALAAHLEAEGGNAAG